MERQWARDTFLVEPEKVTRTRRGVWHGKLCIYALMNSEENRYTHKISPCSVWISKFYHRNETDNNSNLCMTTALHLRVSVDVAFEVLVLVQHTLGDDVVILYTHRRNQCPLAAVYGTLHIRQPCDLLRLLVVLESSHQNFRALPPWHTGLQKCQFWPCHLDTKTACTLTMVRTRDWCTRAAFLLLLFLSRRALPKCQAYDDQIRITNAPPPPPPQRTH